MHTPVKGANITVPAIGVLKVYKRLVLAPGGRDTRSIPPDVKAAVWQRDGGRCRECGDTSYLEFDHVILLSLGGGTSVKNLRILCWACWLSCTRHAARGRGRRRFHPGSVNGV